MTDEPNPGVTIPVTTISKMDWGGPAFLATVAVGIWFVINLNVENKLNPVVGNQARLESAVTAVTDQINKINLSLERLGASGAKSTEIEDAGVLDRAQINQHLANLDQRLADTLVERKSEAETQTKVIAEIETQIRAQDILSNVRFGGVEKDIAMVWSKAFPKVPYAVGTYYPQVAAGLHGQ